MIPGAFAPSFPEVMLSILVLVLDFGFFVAAIAAAWWLVSRWKSPRGYGPRGEGVFTEATVGDDGVLRVDLPTSPRWAGRPVRVVVEPVGPL